jgi:hypothetical protein
MEAHETHEKIHETHHHGGGSSSSKRIAVLISVLAMLLAIVEMGGKSAQNTAVTANIEAANLWAFFQAKTIRMTTMRTAAEGLEVAVQPPSEAATKRIADWRAAAARYDSEPETGEGRKELAARAKEAEHRRDHYQAAYHQFEYGAAALQIAIVLASASVVAGAPVLAVVAIGLGAVGVFFGGVGWFAPELLHL